MDYQAPLKAKSISITFPSHLLMTKSKVTHEGVEVVELFAQHMDIPQKGLYGFAFHLGKVKQCGIRVHHASRIIEIMESRKQWVKNTHGDNLQCGPWLTNQYKEINLVGVDKYISKNS